MLDRSKPNKSFKAGDQVLWRGDGLLMSRRSWQASQPWENDGRRAHPDGRLCPAAVDFNRPSGRETIDFDVVAVDRCDACAAFTAKPFEALIETTPHMPNG